MRTGGRHTISWRRADDRCESAASRCENPGAGWTVGLDMPPTAIGAQFLCPEHAKRAIESRAALGQRATFERGTTNGLARWLEINWEIADAEHGRAAAQDTSRTGAIRIYDRLERMDACPSESAEKALIAAIDAAGAAAPALNYSEAEKISLARTMTARNDSDWRSQAERFAQTIETLAEARVIDPCPGENAHDVYPDETGCQRPNCGLDTLWTRQVNADALAYIARNTPDDAARQNNE